MDARFHSQEEVVLRRGDANADKVCTAIAFDIGKKGMKFETEGIMVEGQEIQVAFSNSPDNIRCFGQIIWSRPVNHGDGFESGLAISSWFGITQGANSFNRYQGPQPKKDRRDKSR